jgi:hypothetical protein
MEQQAVIVQSYFDGTFKGLDRDRAGVTLAGFPMVPPPPKEPYAVEIDEDYVFFDDFIPHDDPSRPRPLVADDAHQCEG